MIRIKKSTTADSRSCDFTKVTREMLAESSIQHIEDVSRALQFFQLLLREAARLHDRDKLTDLDGFHRDFLTNFEQKTWWETHRKVNRHHLQEPDGVPYDVNLIDVLEMIADCVVAGMARTGHVFPFTISPELLMRAFINTVELLKNTVEVEPS